MVEIHTLKPFNENLIVHCAEQTGSIVSIEEHSVIGEFYGAVCEILMKNNYVPVEAVDIEDTYLCTIPNLECLWNYCGLVLENIA